MKQRIFEKMRQGMQEAMEGLVGEAVHQAMAAGIHNKTGQLFTDILNSPRVRRNGRSGHWPRTAKSKMTRVDPGIFGPHCAAILPLFIQV